jgi:hypothetical protein
MPITIQNSAGGGVTLDSTTSSNETLQLPSGGGTLAPLASPVFTGNVGVGVTPEAWRANDFIGLQVGTGAAVYGRGSGDEDKGGLTSNAYYDNTNDRWQHIATKAATNYYQNAGQHTFYVAPSGTADAAISWTTALTITNDGRGLSEFTAKAWCKWAADTTSSNVTYGHNVSSVSYVSQGHWRVNFTNSLTYNYSAQMMVSDNGGRNTTFRTGEFEQSYCGVYITNMDQNATTSAIACFTAFGE